MARAHPGHLDAMALSPTRITVEERADERWLLVHGDLDIEGAEVLRQTMETAPPAPREVLVVDLSAAEFVDSLGLGGLLQCAREAHLAGARLRVFAPHGHQARVLMDLSGTSATLGVMPD